jgi:hypothetical protein
LNDYELLPKKGQFPRKLKRMQQGGSNGGGFNRSEDPKKSAEIRRMAAQKAGVALFNTEVALALAGNAPKFLAALGEPGGVSKELVKRLQYFDDDAKAAGEKA